MQVDSPFQRDMTRVLELGRSTFSLLAATGSTGHGALVDPTVAPPRERFALAVEHAREASALLAPWLEHADRSPRSRELLRQGSDALLHVARAVEALGSTDSLGAAAMPLLRRAEGAMRVLEAGRWARD